MSDEALAEILAEPVITINDGLSALKRIDRTLDHDDGLKWFNLLYSMVVQWVLQNPPEGGWHDPAWLDRLNLNFVSLYFRALRDLLNDPASPPKSWQVLFSARHDHSIMRVQFALCGMNAHINRDLQFALLKTFEETILEPSRQSAQFQDFQTVNNILEAVEPEALEILATGLIDEITEDLGRLDDIVAMWSVRRARETAWSNAEILWSLRETAFLTRQHNEIVERLTSLAGRGLIVHLLV